MLCLIVVYFIFFCKIKATTEIYTYGHTLSLHDALPISDTRSFDYAIHGDDDPSGVNARNAAIVNLFYMNNWLHDWWYDHGFDEQAGNAQTSRSEEHTSELQSLMRISYAVFCLKKKNRTTEHENSSNTHLTQHHYR